MTTTIAVIVGLVILAGLVAQAAQNKRMRAFYDRRCMGRKWRQRFPRAMKDDIREFLGLFTRSFILKNAKMPSFSPEDRLMDVYRTIYPNDLTPDALECETLVFECETRYGIDIAKHWTDGTTLGDIFCVIQEEHNQSTDPTLAKGQR